MSNTKHVQQFVSPAAKDQVYSKRFPNMGPFFGLRKTVLDFEFYPIARDAPTVNQYCRLMVEADDFLEEDMSMMMSQPMGTCEEMLNEIVQVVAVRHCRPEGGDEFVAVHATGENGGKFVWNHDTLELTTCTSDPSFEGAIMENIYNPLFALTVNQGIHFSAQDVRDLMQYNELYCDETVEYSVNDRPSPLRSLACQ